MIDTLKLSQVRDLSAERLEMARGQGATDVMPGGPETVARVCVP